MIRKSSYYVFVPGHVQVFLSGKGPTTVLFKSSLGTVVVHSSFNNNFWLEDSKLCWSRLIGYSTKDDLKNRSANNAFRKLFYNIFESLTRPNFSHFKLIGRGYKILYSKNSRVIHLELGYTQKKVIPLPVTLNLKPKDRYNFELVSLNTASLKVFSQQIRALRPPNCYTAKGTLLNNEVVLVKQGKKSQY